MPISSPATPFSTTIVEIEKRNYLYKYEPISLLTTIGMWGVRVFVKALYDVSYFSNQAKRAFIYGTRRGGPALAKSIRNAENSRYVLDGFVSEDSKDTEKWLMGVKIYSVNDELLETMRARRVNTLLVSPFYTENLRSNQKLVDQLVSAGIHIMMTPQSIEWDGKSDLNYTSLKEVDIEDLLPRDKIEIDMDKVGALLRGKRILITGAAGSIGSEMVRQIAIYHPEHLILTLASLKIC